MSTNFNFRFITFRIISVRLKYSVFVIFPFIKYDSINLGMKHFKIGNNENTFAVHKVEIVSNK